MIALGPEEGPADELWLANVRSLAADIKANRQVQAFVAELVQDTLEDPSGFCPENVRAAVLSALHMGVNIGLEMEKEKIT